MPLFQFSFNRAYVVISIIILYNTVPLQQQLKMINTLPLLQLTQNTRDRSALYVIVIVYHIDMYDRTRHALLTAYE